jgi:hypothetical protein
MKKKGKKIKTGTKDKSNSTNYDILSSIWILACNDSNPQITYDGITARLGLEASFNIKGLVGARAELFRKYTTPKLLGDWQSDMLQGKRLPTWISSIQGSDDRIKAINSLTVEDVFRSQFRSESNSPRSSIDVINWGLQHIERLRSSELDKKHEKTRLFSIVWIPFLSILIAAISVCSSFYGQYSNNKSQTFLKHYEVETKPKQIGYSDFMITLTQTYYSAMSNNNVVLANNIDRIESIFYRIEPFLSKQERAEVWEEYLSFVDFCLSISDGKNSLSADKSLDSFIKYRKFFRKNLYNALFTSDISSD